MRFFLASIILLASTVSLGITYEGKVAKTKNQISFVDATSQKSFTLIGLTPLLSTYINKLSPGDFISVEATKNSEQGTMTVKSFNYVGLAALLGNWVGDDSYCYSFTSFTEFSITPKSVGKKCMTGLTPNFTYIISPSSTSWVMLISGERYNYVGDLKFKSSRELEIQLYDSETGDILSSLRLRK